MRIAFVILSLFLVAPAFAQVTDRSTCVEQSVSDANIADDGFASVEIRRPAEGFGQILGYFVEARMAQGFVRKDKDGVIAKIYKCTRDSKESVRFGAKVTETAGNMHVTKIMLPKSEKNIELMSCAEMQDKKRKCFLGTYNGGDSVTLK